MNKSYLTLLVTFIGAMNIGVANEAALRTSYERIFKDLQSELAAAIPEVSQSRKSAYFDALKNEASAKEALKAAEKDMSVVARAEALVNHAKNHWIKKAVKGIAEANKKLKNAKNAAERTAAKEELSKWEENKKAGEAALEERTANWNKVKGNKPKIQRKIEQAKADLQAASDEVVAATKNLGVDGILRSYRLDGKLARFVALKEATPAALAGYAAQSDAHEEQVESFLKNDALLVDIAVADGPRKQRGAESPDYARMLEILRDIHAASDKASEGVLYRLALAVALEHAAPHKLRAAKADADAPQYVDPVKRYLHFEKAYLDGELDPNFKNLTTWDLRMVVDGEEPEEILTWGREMLRNYRPDHVTTSDHRWRYVGLVRTDIRYGSHDNKYDRDDLQFFQNILKNGGICGRRAFIGRFILRAFGNPTTARPQRGHAALVRWTPEGWVPVLGAGWGSGWTKTPYDRDLDFLATTQARALGEPYLAVKRAHWVGDLMDERRSYGLLNKKQPPEFWNGVALYTQRGLIAQSKALRAVGEELGEANVSNVVYAIETAEVTDADREIRVNDQGVIMVPAAATSEPKGSKGRIIFTPSVLGGLQLHHKRTGGKTDFEYQIDAPKAGPYALNAKVVTPSWQQNLLLSVNGKSDVAKIPLPHTVGMWEYTKPVVVELKKGQNTLRFSHQADGYDKGFSIKEFQLAPVPAHARAK